MMRFDFLEKAISVFKNKKVLIIAGSVLVAAVAAAVIFKFVLKGKKPDAKGSLAETKGQAEAVPSAGNGSVGAGASVKEASGEASKKEAQKAAKKAVKKETKKEGGHAGKGHADKDQKKEASEITPASPKVPTSPRKVIEAETQAPSAPTIEELAAATSKPGAKQPPRQRYVRRRIKDTSVLLTMLDTGIEKGDEALIGQAITGLDVKGDSAVSILREKILENFAKPQVRRYAVIGLFYTGTSETIPVLKTVVKVDPDEQVRLAALYALDNISPDDIGEFLEEVAREDPGERMRKAAKEYIEFRSIDQ
jgi:hypothetical protein